MGSRESVGLRKAGVPAKCGWLCLAVAAAFGLVAAPLAYLSSGAVGLLAALIPALVCLAGSLAALLVAGLLRGPELSQISLLIGMFLRLSIPLALVLVAKIRGGPLVDAGMIYYTLGFYMLTLAVETGLSLSFVESEPTDSAAGAA